MKKRWIKVKSRGEMEARKEAVKELEKLLGSPIDPGDLEVRMGKAKMFDRVKGLKVYHFRVREMKSSDGDIDLDGNFHISFSEEGVFLKIIPPQGKGEPVKLEEVKKEVENLELEDVDWEGLSGKLQDSNKEEGESIFFLAERKPELDRDASVDIRLSGDKLEAYLDYLPPLGGSHITRQELEKEINDKRIVFGLKEEKIAEIPGEAIPLSGILIARGKKPVPGVDGYLEYHFKNDDGGTKGSLREDGSMDYFNLDLIKNVKKGDPLVSVKPPVSGKPGKEVTGEEILPKEPREATLPVGKNVEPDENGKTLFAGIDGQVIQEKGKVSVLPVHQIRGDVDLSTGHINFLGIVIIYGNVTEGFKVEATGDVEINGNVSAATIKSGGDVKIRKGFLGKKKSTIECKGNLEVKFIENGIVKAEGDVIVGDAILHSNISASGKIIVKGKGLIAGGNIQAGQEVEANTLGSSLATKTEIAVGVPPEIRDGLGIKLKDYEDLSDNLSKVKKAIRLLDKQKEKGLLGEERLIQLKKLMGTYDQLKKKVEKLEEEIKELRETIHSSQEGQVKVYKTLFPGVFIQIAGAQHRVKDKRSKTRLVNSKKEIAYTTL